MKKRVLRFCGSLCLVLLAGALPLWLMWRRADIARGNARELEARGAEHARENARETRSGVRQQIELLEHAPAQLTAGSFLEWESFCEAQPWSALRPVLEKRLAVRQQRQPQQARISRADEVCTLLLIRWAREDGAAAAAWVKENLPDEWGRYSDPASDAGSLQATRAWHDPPGFLASLKGGDRVDPRAVCRWIAPRDPALAFEACRQPFDPATDWSRGAAEIIGPFLKTPGEAKTILELLRKEKHREGYPPVNYVPYVLQQWADMDEAAALAAADAYPDEFTGELRASLTHYIMRGHPQTESTADEWLQRLPEKRRPSGVREIVDGLMSEKVDAGPWLLRQDTEVARKGLRYYLEQLTFRDPAAALALAPSVVPYGLQRGNSVARVVAQWAVKSPEAATEMLGSQGWTGPGIARLKDRMAVDHPEAAAWWCDW